MATYDVWDTVRDQEKKIKRLEDELAKSEPLMKLRKVNKFRDNFLYGTMTPIDFSRALLELEDMEL